MGDRWAAILAAKNGQPFYQHACLTVGGTWEIAPGTQYPSFVAQAVDQVFEVPVPYPASFGLLGGPITSPSYEQSVQIAVAWIIAWIQANPYQMFILGGYSQGAEVTSRVYIWLLTAGTQYLPNLVGGYTFGNPCRKGGAHAPTMADPGGHGISTTLMPGLPTINGNTVWADYCHSVANGDAADDMYTVVPDGEIGVIMGDVYTTAIEVQMNNPQSFFQDMVTDLIKIVNDTGIIPAAEGGLAAIVELGVGALIEFFETLITGKVDDSATGADAAVEAAVLGLKFLAAPGGPTAPHISYNGEIAGYVDVVPDAINFVNNLCVITPPVAAVAPAAA